MINIKMFLRTFIVQELEYVGVVGGVGEPSGKLRPLHTASGLGSDNPYMVGR